MIDRVIVTAIYRKQKFDMELPANVSVEKLTPSLLLALQTKGFFPTSSINLLSNGKVLRAKDTLLQSGVWDGSYLELLDRG